MTYSIVEYFVLNRIIEYFDTDAEKPIYIVLVYSNMY